MYYFIYLQSFFLTRWLFALFFSFRYFCFVLFRFLLLSLGAAHSMRRILNQSKWSTFFRLFFFLSLFFVNIVWMKHEHRQQFVKKKLINFSLCRKNSIETKRNENRPSVLYRIKYYIFVYFLFVIVGCVFAISHRTEYTANEKTTEMSTMKIGLFCGARL